MEAFQQLIRARPGSTRVVIHVPTGRTGSELPMELRSGVAYDAELLAEVGRRLGARCRRAPAGLTGGSALAGPSGAVRPVRRMRRTRPRRAQLSFAAFAARIAWTTA